VEMLGAMAVEILGAATAAEAAEETVAEAVETMVASTPQRRARSSGYPRSREIPSHTWVGSPEIAFGSRHHTSRSSPDTRPVYRRTRSNSRSQH